MTRRLKQADRFIGKRSEIEIVPPEKVSAFLVEQKKRKEQEAEERDGRSR